jgi:hypothetical protein
MAPFFGSFSPWQYAQLAAGKPAALAFFCVSILAMATGGKASRTPAVAALRIITRPLLFMALTFLS